MLAPRARAEEVLQLPEITVEDSRLDRYLPARTIIDRPELVVDSQRSELSEVLNLTPGLNVREGGRGETRLDMRGFDQRAVLFTLDGVPVYEPYNGIVNLDLFPLEMLQRVEITRGASSTLFGPNGLAGTVKLRTYIPDAPLVGSLSTLWHYSNTWDSRASVGGSRGRFSGFLGGRYLTSPGFPLSDGFDDRPATRQRFENGGTRLNSDQDEKSAFASLKVELPNDGEVHAAFLGSRAEFGIPPSTTGFAPVFRRNDHQELGHLQAGLDQRVAPNVGVDAAVFYSTYSSKESQFDGPDFSNKLLSTTADSDEVGGIGRVELDIADRDTLTLGGQARGDHADISDTVSGTLNKPDVTIASAALENVFVLTQRVTVLLGLSYDVQTGGGRGTDWELDPQGGVSADLGRFGAARVAVSRKVRFPTLRELFDPLQGNPDLHAERSLTYEVGHRLQRERWYVDTNLFRSEVDGLIAMEGGGNPAPAMNLQDAVLQGVELTTGAAPFERLRIDVNYTYLDATASKPSGGHAEVQHKPAHRFNGILRLFLPQRFTLRLEGLYTSDQVDQFGTDVRAGGFTLFHVRLAKEIGDHLIVFAGVDNILDEDYEQKLGSPQPGRWGYAGFRATY